MIISSETSTANVLDRLFALAAQKEDAAVT
jgi:hypothetical protein